MEPSETYFILRNRQAPCVQISTNSPRPNKDVNLHPLILVHFKLAVFRTENKSKSSKIFIISMNGNAIPNVYTFYYNNSLNTSLHVQNYLFKEEYAFLNVCKVKLLFEVIQLKHQEKLFFTLSLASYHLTINQLE